MTGSRNESQPRSGSHAIDAPSPQRCSSGVLFLVPGFPAGEEDTGCLPAVQNFVAALADKGPIAPLSVLAFQYPYERGTYTWKGVSIVALAGQNRSGLRKLSTWVRAIFHGLRFLRAHAPRVAIHSFWLGECALIGALLSRLTGCPHVASIGGRELEIPNRYLGIISRDRAVITAGSEFAADRFRRAAGRHVSAVIPLGIDALVRNGQSFERDIDILGVGSLIPNKRFAAFIDLVDRLRVDFPDLRTVLVGDGEARSDHERLAARRDLAKTLEFAGHLAREEVLVLMRRSRILLHPSLYESQGYVLLEALASGMHVVSRRVGFASASERHHRCDDDEDMLQNLMQLLSQRLDHSPVYVPTAEETAAAFEALYSKVFVRSG